MEKIRADETILAQLREIGKFFIYAGSFLLLISQILVFFFLVPIELLFAALASSLIGVTICGALLTNSILSLIGFGAGEHVAQDSPQAATLCIVIGAIAVLLSLLVTGGILGAIGGALIVVGGILGLV